VSAGNAGSQEPGEQPEPQMDTPPDPGPGGPADWVERDEDDFPLATPDQPRSAQVEQEHVPDEIEQPEETDEEQDEDKQDTEPGDEPSG
jgi:hypothetical protein